MTDCLRKLGEILNKIDVSKLSPAELAKKLGMELEEFLEKIGNELSDIADSLSEPDFGEISKKFKGLLSQNIIYKTLSEAGDILSEAGDIISGAGDYLGDKISGAIDDLKNISLSDIASAPFKLSLAILSEINDQINKNICNGNFLIALAGLLGDIDGAIGKLLSGLPNDSLEKLLNDPQYNKSLTNLLKSTVIVATLVDGLQEQQRRQKYIAPPTRLTVNNSNLSSSVSTSLSALSGTVTDHNIKQPLNLNYTVGGPWDLDQAPDDLVYSYQINDVFLIKNEDLEVMSDANLTKLLNDKYDAIKNRIIYTKNITNIQDVSDITSESSMGDYIFNIAVIGDTSSSSNEGFVESEITMLYGINKRVKVSADDCEPFNTTKLINVNSVSFSGLGSTLDDSRANAFLECKTKIISDLVDIKSTLISMFNEQT